ncbi:hypothetical protein IX95_07105 [Vibrio sp. B183]|uniref:hypothetical protein n=1 Tax=Vibrio sp. B183 TaxID=1526762 RepID=UPI000505655B|nr:hypothetical protein [Vibrio sp. B183]KFI12715.1 hypothetical protein IX95_07105 [Vibrio sp. B183]
MNTQIEQYNQIFNENRELESLMNLIIEQDKLKYYLKKASTGKYCWTHTEIDNGFYFVKKNQAKSFCKQHNAKQIDTDIFLLIGIVELSAMSDSEVSSKIIKSIRNQNLRHIADCVKSEIWLSKQIEQMKSNGVDIVYL